MILYHGSFLEIAQPDLVHSRPNVDFGRGFYVTTLYEQAAKWCGKFKRRGKDGIISKYEYDESREDELKVLKFDFYCRICKFVFVQKKHCLCCILKGVKHYDSESDFASEKV